MKKKFMYFLLMLVLAFALSACGGSQDDSTEILEIDMVTMQLDNSIPSDNDITEPEDAIGSSTATEPEDAVGDGSTTDPDHDNEDVVEPQNNDTDNNATEVGAVNDSAFSGKVSGCYYADDNMVIVAADKLYLYDTQKGESIANADISLRELYVQAYSDGYFIVGQGSSGGSNGSFIASQSSDGISGYLLNKDFGIEDTISFSGLLNDDFVLGTEDVAISQDGKKIVFGGLRGLYLYDTSAKKVSTILSYSEGGTANNMQILTIDSLAFTGDKSLVYVGTGTSISNGGDGFSIYGTVSIDNGKLVITRKADYVVDEVQKGGDLLIMPQSYNKNNGTLLMFDTASNTEKTMTFSSSSEGKDGVFCSQQGKYVATSTLDGNSVTVKIYDTASGKVIHTETVEDSNSTYFLRIPQILILDESKTCIVVLGRGISEVSTLITTFGFEG